MKERINLLLQLEELLGEGLLSFEHGYNKTPFIGCNKMWGIEFNNSNGVKSLIAYCGNHYNVYELPENKIREIYNACYEYINNWEY